MEKDIGKTFIFSIIKYLNMICLLTLIQLTIASPIMANQRKLHKAMYQTIKSKDLKKAALANYVFESILESSSSNPPPHPFVGFITMPRRRHNLWYEHIVNDDQKRPTQYAVSYGIAVRYGSTGQIAVMY